MNTTKTMSKAQANGAFWRAVKCGSSYGVVNAVLNGANPNARNNKGRPALFEALENTALRHDARAELVKTLLVAGADANTNWHTHTILQRAACAGGGKPEIVKDLIALGADVNAKNCAGQSALWLAQAAEVVDLLLEAGAEDAGCDNQGRAGASQEMVAYRAQRRAELEARALAASIGAATPAPAARRRAMAL